MTTLVYPVLALLVASQGATFTGTLEDKPVADRRMVMLDFTPSNRTDVPDRQPDERLFSVRIGAFKNADAPGGLEVLIVERGTSARLFADRNLDGKITDGEQVADLRDIVGVTSWEHTWDLPAAGGTVLAFRNVIDARPAARGCSCTRRPIASTATWTSPGSGPWCRCRTKSRAAKSTSAPATSGSMATVTARST